MSGIKSHYLQDKDGNIFYPRSHADASYTRDGSTVGAKLDEIDKKFENIDFGGYANVQADWNITDDTNDAYIKNKPTSLPASDVPDWAKAEFKPTYTAEEVGADVAGSATQALQDARNYTDNLTQTLSNNLSTEINQVANKEIELETVINNTFNNLSTHTSDGSIHIQESERANWNETYNQKHIHNNKTILDNITASYTIEDKTKLDGLNIQASTIDLEDGVSSLSTGTVYLVYE